MIRDMLIAATVEDSFLDVRDGVGPRIQIGFDAPCLNTDHVRGIVKDVFSVLGRVDQRNELRWELFADRPGLPFRSPSPKRSQAPLFEFRGFRLRLSEQSALP